MTRFVRLAALSAAVVSSVALSHRAAAQDIVMAGRIHGVELPAVARQRLAKDPNAFEFRRAMKSRLRAAQLARGTRRGLVSADGAATSSPSGGAAVSAARAPHIGGGAVVSGTEHVAVLPIMYSNTPAEPWPVSDLQRRLFAAQGTPETLTQFYTEMSRGNLVMTGTVYPWTLVPGADTDYEGPAGTNGLGSGPGLINLIKATLDQADRTIDFRQYDGDNDGYVDLIAFVQPEAGGECGGTNNIWSHRSSLDGYPGMPSGYQTNDGVIISDYVMQPALNCGAGATPISIGVFAHEFGHALGLPDLYATSKSATNEGLGEWSLMASGSYNFVTSPAHMDAWSKMQLGWAPVRTISADTTHVVMDQIETAGSIIRLNIPGTPEYFLLENRQTVGSDIGLHSTGLLVYHVDSITVADQWPSNTIENVTTHKGIDLVEADGLAQLDGTRYRGGSGDAFPGSSHATSWTVTTTPTTSGYGRTSGIAVTNIVESGGQISFDVAFGPPGAIAVKWGDIDGDGIVGLADYRALFGCLNAGSCAAISTISRADVDADGAATLRDALIMHSYVVGGIDVSRFRVGQPTPASIPPVKVPAMAAGASTKPALAAEPGTP